MERRGSSFGGGFISAAATTTTTFRMDGDSVVMVLFFFSPVLLLARWGSAARWTFSGGLGCARASACACMEVYGSIVYYFFRHVFRYPSFWRVLVDGKKDGGICSRGRTTGHHGSCWRMRWGVGAAVLLLMTRIHI